MPTEKSNTTTNNYKISNKSPQRAYLANQIHTAAQLINAKHLYNYYETCARFNKAHTNVNYTSKKIEEDSFYKILTNFTPKRQLAFTAPNNKNKKDDERKDQNITHNKTFTQLIKTTIPWRKGPFWYGHLKIDSEWISSFKWNIIQNTISEVLQKNLHDGIRIMDIGCNNGYFLLRIATLLSNIIANSNINKELNSSLAHTKKPSTKQKNEPPHLLIGLDPTWHYLQQFALLHKIYKSENNREKIKICCLPLGFQHLNFFKPQFQLALCMGIIYHHKNPLEIIATIHNKLTKNGIAIFECVAAEEGNQKNNNLPQFLFPEKTYLGKKGFWFMPNAAALLAILERNGFSATLLKSKSLTTNEQRSSTHAPYPSLSAGLAKNTTIEGYPLPIRHYVIASKK